MSPTLAATELASLHKPPLGMKTAPVTGLDLKGNLSSLCTVHYFERRNLLFNPISYAGLTIKNNTNNMGKVS